MLTILFSEKQEKDHAMQSRFDVCLQIVGGFFQYKAKKG
jgi:hypothetical protein